jgi:hypothetical protein
MPVFLHSGCRVALWYKPHPPAGCGARMRHSQRHDSHVVSGSRVLRRGCQHERHKGADYRPAQGRGSCSGGNGGEAAGLLSSQHRQSRDRSRPRGCRRRVGWRGEAICQIPPTMKIVYTQGCSFGPERDNQVSYTRTIQRLRRGLNRVVAGALASLGT